MRLLWVIYFTKNLIPEISEGIVHTEIKEILLALPRKLEFSDFVHGSYLIYTVKINIEIIFMYSHFTWLLLHYLRLIIKTAAILPPHQNRECDKITIF